MLHSGLNTVIACLFIKAKIVPKITLSAIWLTMPVVKHARGWLHSPDGLAGPQVTLSIT